MTTEHNKLQRERKIKLLGRAYCLAPDYEPRPAHSMREPSVLDSIAVGLKAENEARRKEIKK